MYQTTTVTLYANLTVASLSTLSAKSEEAGRAAREVADGLGLAAPSAAAAAVAAVPVRAAHGREVRPRVLGDVAAAAATYRA